MRKSYLLVGILLIGVLLIGVVGTGVAWDKQIKKKKKIGVLYGQVTDAINGKGIGGVKVVIHCIEAVSDNNSQGQIVLRTNKRGYYKGKLAAGKYIVSFHKPGYESVKEEIELAVEEIVIDKNNIYFKKEFNVALRPKVEPEPGIVKGKVIDVKTGDPIGGARISFRLLATFKQEKNVVVITNKKGQYHVKLKPGQYLVVAGAKGYYPSKKKLKVISGRGHILNFKLKPKNISNPVKPKPKSDKNY